ncbi:MAG: hypothetical protein VKK42_30410 [Lyngbya sp.]|nr:hypothetical protein [Lyngbya sp.]
MNPYKGLGDSPKMRSPLLQLESLGYSIRGKSIIHLQSFKPTSLASPS